MDSDALQPDGQLRRELEHLCDTMCKALNDPKRLVILHALKDGPKTVTELRDLLDAPQSNTSQHLAVLRERGLVEADRQGNNVYYSLRHTAVLDAIELLREVMVAELSRRNDLLVG